MLGPQSLMLLYTVEDEAEMASNPLGRRGVDASFSKDGFGGVAPHSERIHAALVC